MSDSQPVTAQPTMDEQQPQVQIRKFRRSRQDRIIGGLCGGLGRYLGVDPVLLRVAAVALALSGGLGFIAYIIAWIVVPEETADEPARPAVPESRHGLALVIGAALVALGALLLVGEWVPWFSAAFLWQAVVVATGVAILVSARRS